MKFRFSFVALAFAVLVPGSTQLALCAPPANPCLLLTQAQVSTTLGIAATPGRQEGQFDCEWDQSGVPMFRGVRLFLHIIGAVGSLTPAQQFQTMKTPMPFNKNMVKTPAAGIGDDAVYISGGVSYGTALVTRKGDTVFQIKVQGVPRDQATQVQAKEKTLALDVLANL
jgi:hypothetical protein